MCFPTQWLLWLLAAVSIPKLKLHWKKGWNLKRTSGSTVCLFVCLFFTYAEDGQVSALVDTECAEYFNSAIFLQVNEQPASRMSWEKLLVSAVWFLE